MKVTNRFVVIAIFSLSSNLWASEGAGQVGVCFTAPRCAGYFSTQLMSYYECASVLANERVAFGSWREQGSRACLNEQGLGVSPMVDRNFPVQPSNWKRSGRSGKPRCHLVYQSGDAGVPPLIEPTPPGYEEVCE